MAGNFKVLEEFQDDALTLPVRLPSGKVQAFRIPSPSAEDGLRVQKLMEQGARMADAGTPMDTEVLDDAQELDLFQTALGTAYPELRTAGLDWSRFRHVAMTRRHVDHRRARRRRNVLGGRRRPFSGSPAESGGSPTAGLIGCGEYDEATGLYEWYEHPQGHRPRPKGREDLTWGLLFEQWALIEVDLHEVYRIDLDTPGLMQQRTWRWLRLRILGLLSAESRLARHFEPPEPKQKGGARRGAQPR